jgi:hypothetical protein
VWSAGVTLFSALTGTMPFGESFSVSTLENVLRADVPLASRVGLRAPECLDWVIQCALQRNPQARFHDTRAFADALRCVAARHNLLGTKAQISEWVRRSWGHRLAELSMKVREGRDLGVPSRAVTGFWPSFPALGRPSLPTLTRPTPPGASGHRVESEHAEELTTVRHAPRASIEPRELPRRTMPHAWLRRPAREKT